MAGVTLVQAGGEVSDVLVSHAGLLLCPHHGPLELSPQQPVLFTSLSCQTKSDHQASIG